MNTHEQPQMFSHILRILNQYFHFHSHYNSYDSWLSSGDVEGEVEEPPHPEKPWRVSTQMHTTSCVVPFAAALLDQTI